jgi:hypothetical protein
MEETKTNLSDAIRKIEQIGKDIWAFQMKARDEKVS